MREVLFFSLEISAWFDEAEVLKNGDGVFLDDEFEVRNIRMIEEKANIYNWTHSIDLRIVDINSFGVRNWFLQLSRIRMSSSL